VSAGGRFLHMSDDKGMEISLARPVASYVQSGRAPLKGEGEGVSAKSGKVFGHRRLLKGPQERDVLVGARD